LALTPHIIKIARIKHLFDEPDERKVHKHKIPRLGGLVVAIGFLFTALFFMDTSIMKEWNYLLCAILIILAIGFKDDIVGVSSGKKLLAQVLASLLIIHLGKIHLTSLHGLLGFHEVPLWFGYILSLIAIIVITNAFNLIDGINSLLGMIGCTTSISFGFLFYLMNYQQFALIAFTITGALAGFLYYNVTPAKVFMGDTGSLLLGFLMSVLAIKFLELHPTASHRFIDIKAAVATNVAILIVPLYDTLRVFTIRIFQGKSPFSADRNHIHHLLIDCNLSHLTATLILVLFNISIIIIALLFQNLGNTYLSILLVSLVGIATVILTRVRNSILRKQNAAINILQERGVEIRKTIKVKEAVGV
jgi:UDP-N-acetylmuramyl pentapeptide phosphotransferase/UDP-N-acetylglucosamine-1-phosphate transferase